MNPMFQGTLTMTGGYVPPPIIKLEPSDTLVVSSQNRMTDHHMQGVMDGFKNLYPDHRVVVLSQMSLSVVRDAESAKLKPTLADIHPPIVDASEIPAHRQRVFGQ